MVFIRGYSVSIGLIIDKLCKCSYNSIRCMKIRVNDDILSLIDRTPDLLMSGIASRVEERRLEKGWAQKMLAAKAGISYPSYDRVKFLCVQW